MCGISGAMSAVSDSVCEAVGRMNRAQRHRGPDDEGVWSARIAGASVCLGHRRLAVIDTSAAGHQPMVDPVTGSALVVNGEIYNFRELRESLIQRGEVFRSASDSEVLLRGLVRDGEEFLPRLRGMFALAFVDGAKRQLLLARDPLGVKPLYVARAPGRVLFASEVRALAASACLPMDVDLRGVASLLAFGAVQHPFTTLRAVRSLEPGSCLLWDLACPRAEPVKRRFWSFPPTQRWSVRDAEEAVREQLRRAVREQLVSDVPVGVFLSGGVDSGILAALAAEVNPQIRAFTVTFPDAPDLDEGPLASQTASALGLRQTAIPVGETECLSAADRWLAASDQPSIDGLNVHIVAAAVKAAGITVALSGQGGDELFCGYPSYVQVPPAAAVLRAVEPLPSWLRKGVARALSLGRSPVAAAKIREVVIGSAAPWALALERRRLMSDRQLTQLGMGDAFAELSQVMAERMLGETATAEDAVGVVSRVECLAYQEPMLLRDADVQGMCHALEIRVPFLDQDVVAMSLGMSAKVKMSRWRRRKWLLKRAFSGNLQRVVARGAKRGFTLPLRVWLGDQLRRPAEGFVSSLCDSHIVDPVPARRIWDDYLGGNVPGQWSRALALVALGSHLSNMHVPD